LASGTVFSGGGPSKTTVLMGTEVAVRATSFMLGKAGVPALGRGSAKTGLPDPDSSRVVTTALQNVLVNPRAIFPPLARLCEYRSNNESMDSAGR
jgi:hypothetical protein